MIFVMGFSLEKGINNRIDVSRNVSGENTPLTDTKNTKIQKWNTKMELVVAV